MSASVSVTDAPTAVEPGRVPVVRFNGRSGRAELVALERRVMRARSALRQQGIEVLHVSLSPMTGAVVVRVEDATDAAARALSRRFRPGLTVQPAAAGAE